MSRIDNNNHEENEVKESLEVHENAITHDVNLDPAEAVIVKEALDSKEFNDSQKKNRSAKVGVATVSAATAVIAIASFSVISSSGLINLSMDAKINDMEYVDDGIDYDLTLTDVKTNNSVFFNVMSGNDVLYKYEIPVLNKDEAFSGDTKGHISLDELNLVDKFTEKNEVSYVLRLCGNTGLLERTYDSWTLDIKSMTSVFNSVTYKCNCAVDGYFTFTMDYVDNYSIFKDFEATLEDSTGYVEKCKFTSNFHDLQKILAVNLLSEALFTIKVNKDGKVDDNGNKVYETIYQTNVVL